MRRNADSEMIELLERADRALQACTAEIDATLRACPPGQIRDELCFLKNELAAARLTFVWAPLGNGELGTHLAKVPPRA
jgi:hypothetical protein